jgi:hypothetical protein
MDREGRVNAPPNHPVIEAALATARSALSITLGSPVFIVNGLL